MKNLKKLLAAVLVIAMMVTIMIPAFAAESAFSYTAEAQKLKDLGLYNGISTDTFNPDLGTALDRQTGVVMLLRIFGLEADALALTDADTILAKFTDAASIADWSKKQVAYAVKNGLVLGTSETTFGPSASLNGKAYTTLILRQLGFTVDAAGYDVAPATLAEKGGLTADEATRFASKDLLKNDLVGISFGALSAADKDGVKVITKLVADKVVDETAAVDAGLVDATPAVTITALDVSSAVAITSKVVEVTLATAATADDVAAATIAVKDSADKAVVVVSSELAAYNTDSKAVLVTLEADTAAGTLYTLTAGTKSAKFGGKAADTTKPEVSKVESTDYNKVKITFTEAVKLDGTTLTAAQKYGTKAALAITDMKYSGNTAIEFTTADQTGSTLYGINLSNVVDFAGNKMDTVDSKTFVGQGKSTDNQIVKAAKAVDYNEIVVEFKTKVDPATITTATYTVQEAYGTKTAFTVSAAAAVRADAGDYDSTLATDATKDALVPYLVVLTVTSGTMKDSTLYKITVAGMNTLYGKTMSSTSGDDNKTFPGKSKPSDTFGYDTITLKSNTSLEVKFARKLDKTLAETVGNYAIALAYGTKASLAISKAVLKDDTKIVTLTVAAMTGDLYKLTTINLKDIYGNAIKTGDDATKTFVGSAIQAKIDGITSVTRPATDADTTIIVRFNKNVGATATDVSHYSIDNSVGYPSKAETMDATDSVKLTIPKTIDAKTYKLTVKGLENADGVAMGADGVSATFGGKGTSATLPVIESVLATDKNTVVLYFDRDVTDSKIKGAGKIWNNNQLIAGAFTYTFSKSTLPAPVAFPASNACLVYQDPSNVNALIVRLDTTGAGNATLGTPFAAGDGYTTILFKIADATKAKYTSDTATSIEFATSSTDIAKPEIEAVQGVDANTVKVYFTEPVAGVTTGGIVIKKKGTTPALALTGATVVNGSNDKEWLISTNTTTADMTTDTYEATVTVAGISSKYLTDNKLKPDTDGGATTVKEFAGNSDTADYITNVYGVMINDHVIEVYYPEAMNIAADAVEATTNAQADFEGSYTLTKKDGTALGSSPAIVDVEFDKGTNKATIYLAGAIGATQTADDTFNLTINTNVANLTTNKTIATSSTDNAALKLEVAKSGSANGGATIASATVAGDRMSMDIVMSEDVAFGTLAQVDMDNDTTFSTFATTNANFALKSSVASYDMTGAEFVKAFGITAKFAGDTDAATINATSANQATYIASVMRATDGKTLTVNFKKALVAGIDGTVTTEAGTLAIMNKAKVAAKTSSSDASKVTFAAPNGIAYDTTPSVVLGVTSALANGSYKAGQVIPVAVNFNEEVTVTGTPQLTLAAGVVAPVIDYASGSGTTSLIFNYTVGATDTVADLDYALTTSLGLNGGTIKDAAGNNATLTLVAPNAVGSLGNAKNIVIDTTVPTIASATFTDATHLTIVFSEAVNAVLGDFTPGAVAGGGAATFTTSAIAGSATATIILTVAGNAPLVGANTAVMAVGSTITDVAGNALVAVPARVVAAGGF